MKLQFGDEKIIQSHRYYRLLENEAEHDEDFSVEGRIEHYGEYGCEIFFDCIICEKEVNILLKGENSKTEHCGIIYNKKYRYGREIFLVLNKQKK